MPESRTSRVLSGLSATATKIEKADYSRDISIYVGSIPISDSTHTSTQVLSARMKV